MNMLTPIEAKPLVSTTKPPHPNGESRLKGEILQTLARLDGGAGTKISRGVLRDALISLGAIETDGRGRMTSSARHKFSRAMVALCGKHGALRERNGVVWRVGANLERERAVAAAVAKERAANVAAIAERDRAIEAWKRASAIAKEREAKNLAIIADQAVKSWKRAYAVAEVRATAAERRLANAAPLIAEFRRRLSVLESICDGEPSFAD